MADRKKIGLVIFFILIFIILIFWSIEKYYTSKINEEKYKQIKKELKEIAFEEMRTIKKK